MANGEYASSGEKAELGRGQARQVGENARNAVNNGEQGVVNPEFTGATSEVFDDGPTLTMQDATIEAAVALLDNEKLKEEVLEAWKKKRTKLEREENWNNYIGGALRAKEHEVGSMMSAEEKEMLRKEQEEKERREAEKSEKKSFWKRAAEKKALENEQRMQAWNQYIGKALAAKEHEKGSMMSPEERAELGVEEREALEAEVFGELNGNKGFGRAKGKLVPRLAVVGAGIGVTLFLAACGVGGGNSGAEGMPEPTGIGFDVNANAGESGDEGEGEGDLDPEEEAARSLEEILKLSKDLDFSQLTHEDLELAGNDPELLARFEAASDARVLENGLQLSYENGYYGEKTAGPNSFNPSLERTFRNREQFAEGLMGAYFSQPQELAAGVANSDVIMWVAGVDEEIICREDLLDRARGVYEQMLTSEDGGELQARLRGALRVALEGDSTSYEFYREYRKENSFCLKEIDSNEKDAPETNLELDINMIQRHGESQVLVGFVFTLRFDAGSELPKWVDEGKIISDEIDEDGVRVIKYQEWMDINLKCTQPNSNEQNTEPRLPVNTFGPQFDVYTPESWEESDTTWTVTTEDEEKPEEKTDEEEKPEEEKPEEEKPEEEKPPEETVKQKSPEGQVAVVESGGQTNAVGTMENVDDLKDQGIVPATNTGAGTDTGTDTGASTNGAGDGGENGGGNDDGGTAPVIPAENLTGNTTGTYEVTDEPEIKTEDAEKVVEQQVGDLEQIDEQAAADLNEQLNNMSNDEFAAALAAEMAAIYGQGGGEGGGNQ